LIAERLARHQAGIRMEYRKTARILAEVIWPTSEKGDWPLSDRRRLKAAQIVSEILSGREGHDLRPMERT
jgi:hypothetical protein